MPASPTRITLFAPLANRDASILKDSRLINGYAEKGQEEGEVWVYKRPGLSLLSTVGSGAGQGVFNWKGNIYSVFGGVLYKDGVSKGSVDATGMYTFTSCLGAVPKLFLKNTIAAYNYDDVNGLVQVVDTDYPALTVPGCAYLDGGTYVFTPTNQIIGSEFNDPTSWDPLNVLIAQIEPDAAVAISKQLSYIIALKEVSTEVFYDAGNGTGSPLGPVQGSKANVGCRAAGSVADVAGDLAWIGTSRAGSVQVTFMSKVRTEAISTPSVEKLLAPLDYSTTWAWSIDVGGHLYYVVTIVAANLTLAFDRTSMSWYIWTDSSGNYLPIVSSTYNTSAQTVLQHATNGKLYTMAIANYQDDGVDFSLHLYTPPFDGGLRIAKTCPGVELVADQIDTEVEVSWSDDDYQTFNAPQSVNLNQDRPWLQDGSTFRRRAYLFSHTDSTFFRLKAIDMVAQPGTI